MKKCSYCEKPATYSVGWHIRDGYHENNSCDEHLIVARAQQQVAIGIEEIRQISNPFNYYK